MFKRTNFQLNDLWLLFVLIIVTCGVNFVDCTEDDDDYSYHVGKGFAKKYEFIVKNVTVNKYIENKNELLNYKSIRNGMKSIIIGYNSQHYEIIIATRKKKEFVFMKMHEGDFDNVHGVDLFLMYNRGTHADEVYVAYYTFGDPSTVGFIKILDKGVEKIREKQLESTVSFMKFYEINHALYAVGLSQGSEECSIRTYLFPTMKEFRVLSSEQIPCNVTLTAAARHGGRDHNITYNPTIKKLIIYKGSADTKFKFYQFVDSSTEVNSLVPFKIGFKKFLAVGGADGAIYQFTETGMILENVSGGNFKNIKAWFVLPKIIYKDEIILIGQRFIHHGSHQSVHVEIILYNGLNFVFQEEVPCSHYNVEMTLTDCMTDMHHTEDNFVFNGTVVYLKDMFAILLPHYHNNRLEVFMFHTSYRQVKTPLHKQIEYFKNQKQILQDMMIAQKPLIALLKSRASNSLAVEHPNEVTAPWTVNTVSAPAMTVDGREETVMSENINLKQINLTDLTEKIDSIKEGIEKLRNKTVNTTSLENNNAYFKKIVMEGDFEPLNDTSFISIKTEMLNDRNVTEMFADLVRKDDLKLIKSHKTFRNLNAKNLDSETLNGQTVNGNKIVFKGTREFKDPVTIFNNLTSKSGLINNYTLKDEIVQIGDDKMYAEPLQFQHAVVDSLQGNNHNLNFDITYDSEKEIELDVLLIPKNVSVNILNGESLDEFIQGLYLINAKSHVSGKTVIEGELNVQGSVETDVLNNLRFPDDYLLNGSPHSSISGVKSFDGNIFVEQLTTDGKLNDIVIDEIITLSTNQSLQGKYTFNTLEVTTALNIEGDVPGIMWNEVQNPTLNDTKKLNATVNFYDLNVKGNVIILDNLNGVNFEETLKDVVYKNEEQATIMSSKTFLNDVVVKNNLLSNSGSINEIKIEDFVTKHTEQTLDISKMSGKVHFKNLALTGLYGNTNVTELDQETLKTTGDQFITSILIFENEPNDQSDLTATDFTILHTLNELSVKKYYFTKGNRILKNPMVFDHLNTDTLVVDGEVLGELENFSIKDFDERRLSYREDQIITGDYKIADMYTEQFSAEVINGEPITDKLLTNDYVKHLEELLLHGKLRVKRLQVQGSVTVDYINGQKTDWAQDIASFDSILFKNDVIGTKLLIEEFNGLDFKTFERNIVYKRDRNMNVDIKSFKHFSNGFNVAKMLNAVRLNGIHVDDILMKTGTQNILGPILIRGNVHIENDCEIDGDLNHYRVKDLSNIFHVNGDYYTINSNLTIHNYTFINNLKVEGFVNNENLENFMKNIVFKNQSKKFTGNITFQKPVEMEQNMFINGNLNNKDFIEFMENVVYITNDSKINGNTYFKKHVIVDEELQAVDIVTQKISGINLDNWTSNAVFVNKGRLPGLVTFETVDMHDVIRLDHINDIDNIQNNLIFLHTDEFLDTAMKFDEIKTDSDIPVDNLVNKDKLANVEANTLKKDSTDQVINSNMVFYGHVEAINRLVFNNLVNGKDLNKIVTTDTKQNLTAAYKFDDATFYNNLNLVNDANTINNIRPSKWKLEAVTVNNDSQFPQNVLHNWKVVGNITFNKNVLSNGHIGELDVPLMEAVVKEKHMDANATKTTLQGYYTDLCFAVNETLSKSKKQIYLFKYLENLSTLKFINNINYVHHFTHNQNQYVLINENSTCLTHLFVWKVWKLRRIAKFSSGNILQFITVYDGDFLFLVGRNERPSACTLKGTNVWKFEDNSFKMKLLLEDQELLQESLAPGTFYALNNNHTVIEYKLVTLIETNAKKYRKWVVNGDNLRFVPRGLNIGLAVCNGEKLFRLLREEPVIEEDHRYEVESIIPGNVTEDINTIIPGYNDDEVLTLTVQMGGYKSTLLAASSHEETSVRGKFDFIKIYEDVLTGKVFHKVPSYKPSSLISLEFGNGETLLIFLEDNKVFQVYEYKGIEGFKHRTSIEMEATRLIAMNVLTGFNTYHTKVIGIINRNKINFIQALMTGTKVNTEEQSCYLQ